LSKKEKRILKEARQKKRLRPKNNLNLADSIYIPLIKLSRDFNIETFVA